MARMTKYLAMRTDVQESGTEVIKQMGFAGRNFIELAGKIANDIDLVMASVLLKFIASFSAIYLLVLDRTTNWRTKMLTSLLIPYIFLSLPFPVFYVLRGELGKCIAFFAVILRLFFPQRFPDWFEKPGNLILLIVVSPNLLATEMRESWEGVFVCLVIGCYLLQEHIRASRGIRNSFTQRKGISNTIGIALVLIYPIWKMIIDNFQFNRRI
ncbi:hypothetical protein ZOSMA_264G00290 [Zostera marina]|uniref:Cold-regulated 413 plasma membrane protein 2 n=1 Tax=Zostera marina TaxID=29655 RepID=A0A0K9PH38_ZOSMR|nr:hypothetical protein ZOSMA_264G00290 [Zostera marina]